MLRHPSAPSHVVAAARQRTSSGSCSAAFSMQLDTLPAMSRQPRYFTHASTSWSAVAAVLPLAASRTAGASTPPPPPPPHAATTSAITAACAPRISASYLFAELLGEIVLLADLTDQLELGL